MAERKRIQFLSGGVKCAGWFYKSSGNENAPCVILAHGFCGIKEMRLDAYAEKFSEAGYHALVFDYRYFGESEGYPRQILDIEKQHQDWKTAIIFARSLPEVDPKKIILWGTSFSGGHVLAIAAKDLSIKAIISQVPHINGPASAFAAGILQSIRLGFASIIDILKTRAGLEPYYVPAIGEPGELAAMSGPGEGNAARKLYPQNQYVNENVAAKIFLSLVQYSPGKFASKITIPWLVQVAANDLTTPPKPAIKAAKKARKGELIIYDAGHFDLYIDPYFEKTVTDQINFLKKHIR